VKLSTLLAPFTDVIQEADGYLVNCPAHQDSKPSLRIAINDEGTVLLKCRAGCKTTDVVDAMRLDMRDLFNVEADQPTVTVSANQTAETSPAMVARLAMFLDECQMAVAEDAWATPEAVTAVEYAHERFGITHAQFLSLGLGVSNGHANGFESASTAWLRVPRLVVPFRGFDGVARAAQGRALVDDSVRWCSLSNPKDGSGQWSKLAFFDAGTGLDTIYLTEGPGDGLTIVAAGFDALAIRGAALVNNEALLADLRHVLADRRIIIVGDNDRAGQDFNSTLAEAFADAGLQAYVLRLPDGVEDVNYWRTSDPDAFQANLEEATRKADRIVKGQGVAAPLPVATYEATDVGNAYRLRDLIGLVRFSPEMGFFLYEDGAWVLDKLNAVRTKAQTVGAAIMAEAEALNGGPMDGNTDAAILKLYAWGRSSETTRRIDSMIQELQALQGVAIDVETFDAHHHLLGVANGVVDLRTGALQPHDPGLFLSKRLDVVYDPQAVAPRWEAFLDEVFPEFPDLPAYVQRLVGYGISGETSEQCFVIHWGNGANGKSIFTEALSEVFDAITNTTPFATFEDKPGGGGIPNDVAALKGARLVFASEGERGRPMAEAVIKRVTGRDRITARFMRREFFTFTPTFLLQLATNFKPSFRGQDEGLWRRVKLIPWTRYFAPEERDHYLHLKLKAEAEGILAWAVRGAIAWYAHGLGDPPAVMEATKTYRETSDSLAGFFPGVLEADKASMVPGNEAFKAYLHWCDEEDLPLKEQMTRRSFYAAMEERGIQRVKKEVGQVLLGVKLAHTVGGPGPEGDVDSIFGSGT
jgi:putative DNA primase/helicase